MPIGSTAGENISYDACYGANKSSLWPSTVYLAMFHGDPATTGLELVTTNGYARQGILNDVTGWSDSAGGVKANAAVVDMPRSTGAWSDPIDHWALFDAPTGGNMLDTGEIIDPLTSLATTVTVTNPNWILRFAIGTIQLSYTG